MKRDAMDEKGVDLAGSHDAKAYRQNLGANRGKGLDAGMKWRPSYVLWLVSCGTGATILALNVGLRWLLVTP